MGNFYSIVFPYPKPSNYNMKYPSLYWLPDSNKLNLIPILLYKNSSQLRKLVIFFHGNAEDAASAYDFIEQFCDEIGANGIAVEYPQYGVYKDVQISENRILDDSLRIFDFAVNTLKFDPKNIILFGRSIGSGPATYLSSKREALALILFSPFKSIQDVACDKQYLFKFFIRNIFDNKKHIEKNKNPVLLIHGKSDDIIGHHHSEHLFDKSKDNNYAKCFFSEYMTHNVFNFNNDLIIPVIEFLAEISQRIPDNVNQVDFEVLKKFRKRDEQFYGQNCCK